jgi:cobyrinic acid a,c-diamide synthase
MAELLDAPVVLVVDAASMSSSVRALVDGYHHHLLRTRSRTVAGVVLNNVGSDTHESLLREALSDGEVPVLGVLRRDAALRWRDRHLGLVPVVEDPGGVLRSLEVLAEAVARGIDLEALVRLAGAAPPASPRPLPAASPVDGPRVAVAVLGGRAFSFSYPDNLEALEEAGAELIELDALADPCLPAQVRALYACGGFPEVFAEQLEANTKLLADVRAKVGAGLVTWAECGGALWLGGSLDGHRLCGAIPATGVLGSRVTVGYRTGTLRTDTPVGPRGTVLRGHEHHYSVLDPPGDAIELVGRAGARLEGWATPRLLATYLHVHLGGDRGPAERFVAAAAERPAVATG